MINMQAYKGVLDKLKNKRTVTYRTDSGIVNHDVIAQEWARDFPFIVTGSEKDENLDISYKDLAVIAIQAVIELTKEVEKLKNDNCIN